MVSKGLLDWQVKYWGDFLVENVEIKQFTIQNGSKTDILGKIAYSIDYK